VRSFCIGEAYEYLALGADAILCLDHFIDAKDIKEVQLLGFPAVFLGFIQDANELLGGGF
jgi:hypothetical protein